MFQNAYFLAKFGFDTAENKPAKICKVGKKLAQNVANFANTDSNYADVRPARRDAAPRRAPCRSRRRARARAPPAPRGGPKLGAPLAVLFFEQLWGACSRLHENQSLSVNNLVSTCFYLCKISSG